MRCVKIVCFTPTGGQLVLEASEGAHLMIVRQTPDDAFVDVRDTGLSRHEDGFERMVAQIPASWAMVLHWAEAEAAAPIADTSGGN